MRDEQREQHHQAPAYIRATHPGTPNAASASPPPSSAPGGKRPPAQAAKTDTGDPERGYDPIGDVGGSRIDTDSEAYDYASRSDRDPDHGEDAGDFGLGDDNDGGDYDGGDNDGGGDGGD